MKRKRTAVRAAVGEAFSGRRVILLTAVFSLAGGLLWGLYRQSVASGLSLTGTGALAIINFRWLEAILSRVLLAPSPRIDGGVVLRFAGRMLVLMVLLAALFFISSVDGIGVALGYSCLVAAVVIEGLRS